MSEHPLGTFDGKVVNAFVDLAYQSETDLELVFEVVTDHGLVKCKHPLYDKSETQTLDRAQEVLALFGLRYPETFEQVADLGDKQPTVRVWVSEMNGNVFGKINAGGKARDPERVKAAIRRAKGGDETVPF